MFRCIGILIASLVVGTGVAAWASETSRSVAAGSAVDTLTLGIAVERAISQNPRLKSLSTERDAERARGETFSLAPPLQAGAQLENFAGTGDARAVDSLESTLSLAGVLELGNKRAARVRLAAARLNQLDADQLVRRLDLVAEVARRYLDVVTVQAYSGLHRDNAAITGRVLESVRARSVAGRAGRADVAKAEIALTRARLDEAAAARNLAVSRASLSSLWGVETADFQQARGDLFQMPELEAFETLATRLEANPDLAFLTSQVRVEDARSKLADAARHSDLDWTAGVRRLEAIDDQAFVVGISMALGSAKRAEPIRREAEAERSRIQWESQAMRLELRATLFSAHAQLEQKRTEVLVLLAQSKPLAEEALRLTEQGYATGRYSLLELADAQAQLLGVTAEIIEAAANFHVVLIEIQRLTNDTVVNNFTGI